MSFFSEFARRLSMLFHRSQFDANLEEEMRLHLELREQERLQRGMTQIECALNNSPQVWKSHSAQGKKSQDMGMAVV
jgi:hypothetical protein